MKSKFNFSKLGMILGTVIVFGLLILFFYKDKQALNVVLTTITGVTLIFTVIYEGDLKRKKKSGSSELTGMGIFLVILYVVISVLNGINSNSVITENEHKTIQDSIKTTQIILDLKNANQRLEDQRLKDSVDIVELNTRLARLDTTLILNALNELEEQRKKVEEDKENVFMHLKSEIIYNLRLIYHNYSDSILNIYKNDDNNFIETGFKSNFIDQYKFISQNDMIINNLSNVETYLNTLDKGCKLIGASKGDARKENVDAFRNTISFLHRDLYSMLSQIHKFESYKEFESIKRGVPFTLLTIDQLQKLTSQILTPENINNIHEIQKELHLVPQNKL